MKKQVSILITVVFLFLGISNTTIAQDKEKTVKSENQAKLSQSEAVSIFQVRFKSVDQTLKDFLSKNEAVLHFRGELNTYVLYLTAGKTKQDLTNLLKQNDVSNFEIIVAQQGSRKQNLFNKQH